jgi:transcriptional regulator with XRE-family HTH domain
MFNLTIERKRKKLTQQDLGKEIGVSRVQIARYEAGLNYPSVENLKKLAEYFQVTTDYLLKNREE